LTFVSFDKKFAFTGDALLIRGAGRTDFQGGDPAKLFASVRKQIFSLPDDCLLYPAHDYSGRTVTTVGEEKSFNPRLGERVRESDFIGYMNHLGLPHPKKMDAAVPANLRCGKPNEDLQAQPMPTWGPVIRTYAGVWQVEPEWVFTHRREVNVVDVREREEVEAEPLGIIPESTIVPLSELREGKVTVPKDKPVITICPSGARSAIAASLIEKMGAGRVANLRGGLLGWRDLGYPLES
jgi:rhodanese-related sulfurtransferase